MIEDITSKIKEIRGACDIIEQQTKSSKIMTRYQLVIYFAYVFTITVSFVHPWGAIGYFTAGILTLFAMGIVTSMLQQEKLRKENEVHMESAKFLESYYKGTLMENGYDWRKV
jgi:hypothetical protein